MKRISLRSLTIYAFGLFLLSACGGGGGTTAVGLPPSAGPVAVVTLSTEVTGTIPANTTINGYVVTMTLPTDVTCKSTSGQTDPGVVTVIGSATGSLATGMYTAATASLPGAVKVTIVSGPGYAAGAFCTVRCDLANSARPAAAEFVPLTLDDATGLISGTTTTDLTSQLTVTASVVIQ